MSLHFVLGINVRPLVPTGPLVMKKSVYWGLKIRVVIVIIPITNELFLVKPFLRQVRFSFVE